MRNKILKNITIFSPITISALAIKLKINRIFLSGYLQALEDSGEVKSKTVGAAKVYQINKR